MEPFFLRYWPIWGGHFLTRHNDFPLLFIARHDPTHCVTGHRQVFVQRQDSDEARTAPRQTLPEQVPQEPPDRATRRDTKPRTTYTAGCHRTELSTTASGRELASLTSRRIYPTQNGCSPTVQRIPRRFYSRTTSRGATR